MHRLSTKLFRRVANNTTHTVYATIGSPLILVTDDGTALASLHFRESSRKSGVTSSRQIIAPLTVKNQDTENVQQFQCISNENGKEIEFELTNLSSRGYIDFNLMKNDKPVTETNPGGINQINELQPYQSIIIRCDQMNNLPMILSKHVDEKGETVTVKKDSDKKINESDGSHIYLSVVPQANVPEQVAMFEPGRTSWKVLDLVAIKDIESDRFYQSGRSYGYGETMALSFSGPSPQMGRSLMPLSFSGGSRPRQYNEPMPTGSAPSWGASINESSREEFYTKTVSQQIKVEDIVNESKIGVIEYGTDRLTVNSCETDIVYDFEKPSSPCVIGLSVNEKLEFVNVMDYDFKTDAEAVLQMLESKKYKDFLNGKIYDTDECVVCLDNKPDCVFFGCAHKCCCYECTRNLQKCAVCRRLIVAKFKA